MEGARVELTKEQQCLLLNREAMPTAVSVNGKRYAMGRPVDAGFKGAIWRVTDEFGRTRALKFCTASDYEERSYLQEMAHASKLEKYKEFAYFVDAGICEVSIEGSRLERYVCFVEEWVEGETLRQFVENSPADVTAAVMLAYVKAMCQALNALRHEGLRHDDLHAGNVMIMRPAPADLSLEWRVKVIDTGSMKLREAEQRKSKDDHRHFVDHLVLLWNAMHSRRCLSGRDRRFLRQVTGLLQSMLDDDPIIRLSEPAQVARQFDMAYARAGALGLRQEGPNTIKDPFEFISAEHISDDRFLVETFAQSCPFLDKVDGPDPCLVTGPRGCGKSTIFRWLSLKAHLHQEAEEIDRFRIAGFYVSCSTDLQNRFGWIRSAATADRFRREIIHYFNLLLSREVIQALVAISSRPDRIDYWGFDSAAERGICEFFNARLESPVRPRIQGVSRLVHVLEDVEAQMFDTHAAMLRGQNISSFTGEVFLGDLTTLLRRSAPFFSRKPIAFLLDDFSVHRLPDFVQIVLNRVIWERRPSHVFKLSSEKGGAVLTDTSGATIEVAREMIEIDCGREYIALDDSNQVQRARAFAVELLNNRLKAAGYRGTAEALIGQSEWEEGSLGRALAISRPGRTQDQYHGIECIADLCSGDVSTLLLIYRRIFEVGAVGREMESRIERRAQHTAIVDVSRELFEAIKHLHPGGPQMYSVVAAFGSLARNILQHGRWVKKGDTTVPAQCPRIELDQRGGAVVEALSEEQHQLSRELVRRAIFIEMEPGLSRHRSVTTLRWNLRRVFLPSFGASLAKNDAVKRSVDWLKFLLTNPQGACEMVWQGWPKQRASSDRLPLFEK